MLDNYILFVMMCYRVLHHHKRIVKLCPVLIILIVIPYVMYIAHMYFYVDMFDYRLFWSSQWNCFLLCHMIIASRNSLQLKKLCWTMEVEPDKHVLCNDSIKFWTRSINQILYWFASMSQRSNSRSMIIAHTSEWFLLLTKYLSGLHK